MSSSAWNNSPNWICSSFSLPRFIKIINVFVAHSLTPHMVRSFMGPWRTANNEPVGTRFVSSDHPEDGKLWLWPVFCFAFLRSRNEMHFTLIRFCGKRRCQLIWGRFKITKFKLKKIINFSFKFNPLNHKKSINLPPRKGFPLTPEGR